MALPIKTILQEKAIISATHWSKKKLAIAIHFPVFLFSLLSCFQVEDWIFFNLEASTRNDMGVYFEI